MSEKLFVLNSKIKQEVKMIRTYKYRVYPTKSQETKLENTFSICRALYNYALEHRIIEFKRTGRAVSNYEQSAALPEIKKLYPWYKSVYASVLQDALKRLDDAYSNFFRRMKDSKIKSSEKGFPKFKKQGQWNSISYNNKLSIKPIVEVENNSFIYVPNIGNLKIIVDREFPIGSSIKTMSVIKDANRWFITFSVEVPTSYPELNVNELKSIGIDAGLIDFYYSSDETSKRAPRLLRVAEKNLKRLHRKLSASIKRSREWYKVLKSLKNCYYKVRMKRLDFLYKTSYELFKDNDIVFREDLNLKNLIRRPKTKKEVDEEGKETGNYLPNGASSKSGLNKSFSDASFCNFFTILDKVALKLGKLAVSVNPAYTSQDCSNCGNRVKKSLSTRTHQCLECGLVLNRDLNASLNIKRLGLQSLGFSYP